MEEYTSSLCRYILTTPVKNEEKNLSDLLKSVVGQTVRPLLWVIVDDGSTDNTPEIIKEAIGKYEWIKSISLDGGVRDRGPHLANVMKKGFDFAIEYCKKNGIIFDYVGNVDADVILESSYFEKLSKKFEDNLKLGIASGGLWFINGDQTIYVENRFPDGGDVLYRKKCFEDCGGIPLTDWWDSVLNVKAKLRGWEIKRFDDSKAFVVRGYCRAEGLWEGFKKFGESSYINGFNLSYALAKGLKLSFKKSRYVGFAYLYGYLSSLILRKKQINDEEIKYYYKHIRPREIKQYYFKRFKSKFKWKGSYK